MYKCCDSRFEAVYQPFTSRLRYTTSLDDAYDNACRQREEDEKYLSFNLTNRYFRESRTNRSDCGKVARHGSKNVKYPRFCNIYFSVKKNSFHINFTLRNNKLFSVNNSESHCAWKSYVKMNFGQWISRSIRRFCQSAVCGSETGLAYDNYRSITIKHASVAMLSELNITVLRVITANRIHTHTHTHTHKSVKSNIINCK